MFFRPILISLSTVVTLSACGGGVGDVTTSRFATPQIGGTFSPVLNNQRSGSDTNGPGRGYAYRVGTNSSDGAIAEAGFLPGTSTDPAPMSGVAVYTGRFEVARVENISTSGNTLTGTTSISTGAVQLEANFDTNAITTTDSDQALDIDATISNGDFTGSVTYDGIPGRVQGMISADEAIGVFNGNDDTNTYAGGFIVE